jgi:Ca-activated chloride channel family protein
MVTDRRGATVTGLGKGHFQLYQDKVPQEIVTFSREAVPASIGLIFDLSGSMKTKIAEALSSTNALFKGAEPDDEAFLMTFSNQPEVNTGFTTDLEVIQEDLHRSRTGGRTALIDAVYLGLNRMRQAKHGRRAVVIVSDGMDNHSRYSKVELMSNVVESDVQIYTIGVYDPPNDKKPIELNLERAGISLLDDLAQASGGLHFQIRDASEIARVAEKIGTALHNQYVLGYSPVETAAGWHKIQVKVDVPNVRLYSRTGYLGRIQ